jgi:MFS family permease
MVICALAPSVWFLVLGASLVGVGGGSFLAVDWALMTDIIPKASAGRFMGISNVATATNGVVAGLVGYVIVDRFAGAGATDLGPRAAFLLAPVWFCIGAWLLRPVDERRREDRGEGGAMPLPAAAIG